MKRFITLVLFSLATFAASAQLVDRGLRIQQYNAAVSGFNSRDVLPAVGPGILMLDVSGPPVLVPLGPGLSFTAGILDAASSAPTSGQIISALGYTPYDAANPAGYLSSISGPQVTTALGFTPYNASNPAGYISGITSGQVTTALGFNPYDASNPSGFVTSSGLSSTLSAYTTTAAMTTAMAGKMNTPTGTISQYMRGDGSVANFPDLSVYATNAALTSGLSGKFNTPGGTTAQYLRGDGSAATFPTIPPAITLTTTGTSGAATLNTTTGALNIPAYANSGGTVTSVGVTSTNLTVSGSPVTTSGSISVSLPNTGTAGTYSTVTTDAQGRVTSGTGRSVTYGVTKALNTCFQVSATRDADVKYNVQIVSTGALIGGQQGTIYLEAFTDSACTTGTTEIERSTNGNTSALIVAVGNVSTTTLSVQGPVAAGAYLKIRTENNTGTPTYTVRPGWEKLN